jgi:hypothetical protein
MRKYRVHTGYIILTYSAKFLARYAISDPVLKTDINGRGDPLRWPRDILYPQKLALTSLTSGGRSVGIVHLRTKSHGVFLYNIWWRPYAAETYKEEEGWLDNKLHLIRKYMSTKNILMQQDAWIQYYVNNKLESCEFYIRSHALHWIMFNMSFAKNVSSCFWSRPVSCRMSRRNQQVFL